MAYTFNLDSVDPAERQVAAIRDEIDDVAAAGPIKEGESYFLSDERIQARIAEVAAELGSDTNASETRLWVAASCLDTLATNQAYVLKKGRTLSEEFDGAAVGKEIRAHADTLRKRARASLQMRRDTASYEERQAKPIAGRSRPTVVRF